MFVQVKDCYHDGDLVVNGRKVKTLGSSIWIFTKIAEVFVKYGDIEAAIAMWSTIAYICNQKDALTKAAHLLAEHDQWDLSWAVWQRIHNSALNGSTEPGYVRYTCPSLMSHCKACVMLGFLDQAAEVAEQVCANPFRDALLNIVGYLSFGPIGKIFCFL